MTQIIERAIMSIDDFQMWLARAPTGNSAVYHVGYIAADRLGNPDLCALANIVLKAAEAGLVSPVQARMPGVLNVFIYYVQKCQAAEFRARKWLEDYARGK